MRSLKTACVTWCLAGLLSSMGCCYHAQHFGKRRDIGLGEIGCATCDSGGDCDRGRGDHCGSDCSHTITVPMNPVNPVNKVR